MDSRIKYDEAKDYQKLAEDYLQTCGREQTKLPKISEFCREYVQANEDTVTEWLNGEHLPDGANTYNLSVAIKRVKQAQAEQLMDDGLYGGKECNVGMAIFLLKANHGMIETDRHELRGSGFVVNLGIDGNTGIKLSKDIPSETT